MKPESLDNKIDMLNEEIQFKVDIDSSCAPDFPRIEEGDFETKMERGVFLIGKWTAGETVDIKIEGVFEAGEFIIPNPKGHELAVDLIGAQESFNLIKKENVETEHLGILGDIHTHPYEEDELGRKSWTPSSHDIKAWTEWYKFKVLNESSPYIFGIVTQNKNNKGPQLALYRVVKKESGEFSAVPMNDWNWS